MALPSKILLGSSSSKVSKTLAALRNLFNANWTLHNSLLLRRPYSHRQSSTPRRDGLFRKDVSAWRKSSSLCDVKNERGRGTKVSKRSTDDERRGRNRDARASDHRARERPSTSTASKEGDRWTRRSASRDDTPHRPQSPVGLDEK